jgi:hypothetical protein
MAAMSAGAFMEYAEKEALAAVCLKTQSPAAATTYLALLTAAPTQTDLTMAAEAEFSTSDGYARQPITNTSGWTGPSSASPSVISNALTITFGPITTAAPGTATWAMLTDAVSGTSSNCIIAFLLANSRTPLVGDSLVAAAGNFTAQVLQKLAPVR